MRTVVSSLADLVRRLAAAVALCSSVAAGADPVQVEDQGLRLNGALERLAQWPSDPVLLVVHGTLSHNGSEIIRTLQQILAERELVSLAINLSLALDNRQGPYDCAIPHRHRHEDASGEIGRWLQWLEGQGVAEVVLVGHSRGGNQAAWFSRFARHPLVRGQVLLAPQRQFGATAGSPEAELLAQAEQLPAEQLVPAEKFLYCSETQASAQSVISYYAADERKDTSVLLQAEDTLPTLLLLGTDDTVVAPAAYLDDSVKLSPRVSVQILDGADHFFRDLFMDEVADYVVEFLAGLE